MRICGGVDLALRHKVTLSDYSISKYETTWDEFDLYYEIIGKELLDKKFIGQEWRSSKMPVSVPSWNEAKNYCKFIIHNLFTNFCFTIKCQKTLIYLFYYVISKNTYLCFISISLIEKNSFIIFRRIVCSFRV